MESLLSLLRPDSNGITDKSDAMTLPLANIPEDHSKVDQLANNTGNFSAESIAAFQQAVGKPSGEHLRLERYVWPSVNHHIGRVKAAIELIDFIEKWTKTLSLTSNERILVQAHGHAGQLLSVLSNLITHEDSSNRQILFQVLANHHDRTQDPELRTDRLESLYRQLTEQPFLGGASLDVVTYGTPVRGGWDTTGIGQLLHIVNHRPVRGDGKHWLAKMELPQIAWEIPMLSGGDYVQQLAVAGSDHVLDSPDQELVNQELREILEPYDGFERWLECARRGTRCQNDGTTLLVDYQLSAEGVSPRVHLFGHGCYTEKRAMLFQTTQVCNLFY